MVAKNVQVFRDMAFEKVPWISEELCVVRAWIWYLGGLPGLRLCLKSMRMSEENESWNAKFGRFELGFLLFEVAALAKSILQLFGFYVWGSSVYLDPANR